MWSVSFSLSLFLALEGCSERGFRQAGLDPGTVAEPGPVDSDTGTKKKEPPRCVEGEVSWELVQAWNMGRRSRAVAVGRLFDSDRDGDVDYDDLPMLVSSELGLGGDRVEYFAYQETDSVAVVTGAERSPARLGDLDGRPGAEVAVSWHVPTEVQHRASVFGASTVVEHRLPSGSTSTPWLADVDDDGDVDILVNGGAVDALDGSRARSFRAVGGGARSVAVDLDLDGIAEVITALPRGRGVEIGILGPDDELAQVCVSVENDWRTARFAVGNLDGDDGGEFVVAASDVVAVCDTNGTLIQQTSIDLDEPAMVGLADLSGDDTVEIIVTGARGPVDLTTPRMVVLDRNLSLRWERLDGPWFFSIADLDDNGTHEILIQGEDGFRILDGQNQELARWGVPLGAGALAQPVVADVDQDGLAEIVLPHQNGIVLETPSGGFPTVGATDGWSGVDHFPGLMAVDGRLDTHGAHWLQPGGNAWQGHARCVPAPADEG